MSITDAAPTKKEKEEIGSPGIGNFRFLCNPETPCFTACCADLRLLLTPYDVLRLKKRLRLTAGEFIRQYAEPLEGEFIFPLIRLKMRGDERRSCPFVSARGCMVYMDRPGACRLYPLGRASDIGRSGKEKGALYFLVDEPHCLGFRNARRWTVEEWVQDQGAKLYNEMNRPWTEIVMGANRVLDGASEQKLAMFYMASYNLDHFRKFIFRTKFLTVFDLSQEEIERVAADEVELMKLGARWLRFALFGESTLVLQAASPAYGGDPRAG